MISYPNIGIADPGRDVTGRATAAVTSKRFLAITGPRSGGNVAVAHATAAGRVCGVAKYDAVSGDVVGVSRGNSRVTFVASGGTAPIAAFGEVEVGPAGTCVPHATGVAVGYAVTDCAVGADAEISLY